MLTVPVKSLAVLRVKVLAPALIRFRLPLILPAPKIVKLLRLESLVKAAGVTTTLEPIITPVTKPGVSSKRTLSPGKKVSLARALRLYQLVEVEISQALLDEEFQRRLAGVVRVPTRVAVVVLVRLSASANDPFFPGDSVLF